MKSTYMRWQAAMLGALLVLACAAPQAAPVPIMEPLAAAATAATWTPEPWKLTATAEVVQGPALAAQAAAVAAAATADRQSTATAHYQAAQSWQDADDYGLALEESRQAAALWPDNVDLRRAVTTIAQQATRVVPTRRAIATTAAIDALLAAQEATAVARWAPTATQAAVAQARRAATDTAYSRACRFTDGRLVLDVLSVYVSEMRDELRLANRTARIALGQRIADLQETKRAVQRERWPPCAGQAAIYLVRAMVSAQ